MKNNADQDQMGKKKPPFMFYVILGAIPFLFLVLLEVSLRLAGYGVDYKLFVKNEASVAGMKYINPEISYKYFGRRAVSVFNGSIGFYESKPANGLRVFVFGGSSTQGFPYSQQASFPSQLKRRLDLIYPDRSVEVINLGTTAVNSYTLVDILPEVLEESPDLILIYAGHNEYYGALGPASSKAINPTLAKTILFLRDYRIVQLIENLIAKLSASQATGNKNLMQTMIGQSFIEYGSATYQKGIDQLDVNLSSMIRMIQAADVPVVIGTLSSNIGDHRPFNSDQLSDQGLSASDYFNLAKEQVSLNDSISAKTNFTKAKEYDGLRFRAPEKINELIKAKANEFAIPLADIEAIFSQNSKMNITGNNLMCDHLHPNLAGYFLMSKAYSNEIHKNELLPKSDFLEIIDPSKLDSILLTSFPYTYLDTLIDTHLLLSGIGQYPFVPIGEPNPYQEILDNDGINFKLSSQNEVDSIRAILASEYLLKGDSEAFVKEISVFTSYFPQIEHRYLHSINLLDKLGVLSRGYPLIFKHLQTLKESNAKTKAIGGYYKHIKRYDSALVYLNKARELSPNDSHLLLDIGFIQTELENYEQAINEFSKVLDLDPENLEAYHQRAVARFELKDYSGTIKDLNELIKLQENPDTLTYIIRGYAKIGVKDQKGGCEDWKLSADLGSAQARVLYQTYCKRTN